MPRKPLIRTTHLPYHIVNRNNRHEWFQIPIQDAWSEFQYFCSQATHTYGAKIHAFVLMSNHFHLMMSTPDPDFDLGQIMQTSGNLARSINSRSRHTGHLFTGRYKSSLIDSPYYYAHALKYVYRNPVKAGLVSKVEDYAFSTLHGLTGGSHLSFPVVPPLYGLDSHQPEFLSVEFQNWLNTPTKQEDEEAIKAALVRSKFKIPKIRNTRRDYSLEPFPWNQ